MKIIRSLIVAFTFTLANHGYADEVPGLIEYEIQAPHHGRAMQVAVWYPASAGKPELFADNPIFLGGKIRRNAKPSPGRHPIVLLSHGMGGTYLSLNWLATGLAEKGAIVISVNHPNGWFKDRQADKMFNHWTRVQDLEAALDDVLKSPGLKDVVDKNRIYAAGFSFGGWTALSLGGATASPTGNLAYCKAAGERSHNCTDLQHFGLSAANTSDAQWTASHKDARITAMVALDPGFTWGMTTNDVRDLDQKSLLVIGLGTGDDQHYATDTSAKGSNFDSLVPLSHKLVIAPATHFTAMPVCKPEGADILASENDDPVCTDPAGADRKAVHDKIIELVTEHFALP